MESASTAPISQQPAIAITLDDLDSAFDRVAENQGCAGVDGVRIEDFARDRDALQQRLLDHILAGSYRPFPLLQIIIEKKPGTKGWRRLLVPAVRDRVLQTAVARHLSRSFEDEFLEVSYAYRPGRGVDRAIARVRQLRDLGYWHVVDADIRAFFDNVNWSRLMEQLATRVPPPWDEWIHGWIGAPVWDGTRLRRRSRGLPQGSPVSPLLANLFLHRLDVKLLEAGGHMVRYADDFIILARTAESARALLAQTTAVLTELDLELNAEKTRLADFDSGFRFLGVLFDKHEIWRPWKDQPDSAGRILQMAAPMPAWRLAEYDALDRRPALAAALERAGVQPWRIPKRATLSQGEPDVAYLYLAEPGAVVRKSGDRILVEYDNRVQLDIPYHKLEHVLLFGPVQVTTQAMHELLEKGVDLSLFSSQGQFRGSLSPPRSGNALDRIAQYELWKDDARSLVWARQIVAAKIANSALVLDDWTRGRDSADAAAIRAVRGQLEPLEARCLEASSRDELLGVEGLAARLHFEGLGLANQSAFLFPGRRKHPAPDPVNALLSLAYTLITQEMASLVESEGLDPCLGVLHEIDRSRPSLALDLIEPFRGPLADRFVVRMLNLNMVDSRHFQTPGPAGGLLLVPEGLKAFLREYETWMLRPRPAAGATYRDLLRGEVRRLLAALRSKQQHSPFRYREEAEKPASESEPGPGNEPRRT